MKVLIVFNHPYEGSFCNAILKSVTKGLLRAHHTVDLIHLDKDGFNPVLSAQNLKEFRDQHSTDSQVLAYKYRLEQADHLIFIFPIWWELMPALTKGFIDKVIIPGIAYDYSNTSNTMMKPLLSKLRGVTVITTMNTPALLYRFIFGNAIQRALLRGTFWKLGYKNRKWISFNRVKAVSVQKRKAWLVNIEKRFSNGRL